jgi:hypothetical protein
MLQLPPYLCCNWARAYNLKCVSLCFSFLQTYCVMSGFSLPDLQVFMQNN